MLLLVCSLLILVTCGGSAGEDVEETAVFPSSTPKSTLTPLIIGTVESSPSPISIATPSSMPPTPPIPDNRITQTTSVSPNGHGVVHVRISDHFQPNADDLDQFPNGKYHVNMVVTDARNVWTVIDEWRGSGMGEPFPEIIRWSADGRSLYYANIPKPDGCSLFVNGGDLWQLDLASGAITEVAPYIGLVMALSPDETKLAVHASYGRGFLIRDLATGEEQPIPLPEQEGEWQINGLQWSPDGKHLLLTQAVNACGGNDEMKTAVIRINSTDLSATTILDPDERSFTLQEWVQDDEIRLKGRDGAIWHLDPLADEWTLNKIEVSQTGLIYRTEDGLWQITESEQPRLLLSQPDAKLSPNGSRALYQDEDTLIIVELTTGEEKVIDLSLYDEWGHAEWGGNDLIFLGTLPEGEEFEQSFGFLTAVSIETAVSTDSNWQRILDPENKFGTFPALSPDTHTIAHENPRFLRQPVEGFRLIQVDGTVETIDPATFAGLPNTEFSIHFGSPAWSPDGRQLAWAVVATVGKNGEAVPAIALFNMENKTAVILHPYKTIGRCGWFEAPVWSPDGKWIAFVTDDADFSKTGIWITAVDDSEEHYIGGNHPVWNEDGSQLAYSVWEEGETAVLITETDNWRSQPIDLPPNAIPIKWLSNP